MNSVYEGGLPSEGTNLFPKTVSQPDVTESYGGELGIKTTRGGPATNTATEAPKSFIDDASYHPADLEVSRPSTGKTVDWIA